MRQKMKYVIVPILAAVTAFSMNLPSYAATRNKVASVRLEVKCDEVPAAGETIGSVDVTVKTPSDKVEVSEKAEYYDTNDDEWERGEVPTIRLEVSVKDNEKDYFTSSTKVTVSGYHSEIKSKKVVDSGNTLRIDIKLRKVSGDLGEVGDLWWDGRTATWEEIDDANRYEVKLYRGSTTVTTITTSGSTYNFYPYMSRSGDYTFKVRGVSTSDGEKSAWSDESEEYYMSQGDAYTGTPPSGSNGSGNSGSTSSGWNQDGTGWRYFTSGNAVRNAWVYVDNNWFYMADNSYMMTGWIFVDNNWFYLNPISDGTRGAMKTGWQNIDGNWYYLNPVSDGTRGARRTSYQMIDGRWYFFDLNSGAMWANRVVPNGKWADVNGVIN